MVRIFPKAADHTKKAALNETLVLQTLFQGKRKAIKTTQDIVERFNTKHPSFGRDPP